MFRRLTWIRDGLGGEGMWSIFSFRVHLFRIQRLKRTKKFFFSFFFFLQSNGWLSFPSFIFSPFSPTQLVFHLQRFWHLPFKNELARGNARKSFFFFSQKNIILRKSEIQELDASYEKASSMQQQNMQMIRKRLLSYILLLRIRYRQLTFHSFIFLERDN